jgi:predicted neuraminidase
VRRIAKIRICRNVDNRFFIEVGFIMHYFQKLVFILCFLCSDLQADELGAVKLDLSLEPPVINTSPGPEYDDRVRIGNMVIGIERTSKGRLWACWVGNGDSPNGFFMLATSDDGGASWSKPRVVIDPTDPPASPQRRALVGNLWTDPLGRLWLFFDQSLGYFDGRGGDWFIRCDNPDADEPTWTKPVRFADGCTLNKPTALSNGEWLLPVSLWTRDRIGPTILKEAHHDLDSIRMANVFVSSNQGETWTRRGGVAFPDTDFDEHMIVEKKDGRLWMLARTKQGISESYSADQGKTWSAPQPSSIKNVSARFFIRRLASGNLLLVKNGPIDVRLPRRSSMTAFLSHDDGATWSNGLLLDDRAEVSYPDGIQASDGQIHLLYDWNRHTDAEILLAKFREEDITAGKFTTPGSKARLLVNKAYSPHLPKQIVPDPQWTLQAKEDAKQDFSSIPYDGVSPNKMVCDTTLRELPDGSWILFILAGGDTEPSPLNYTGVTRSKDRGKTWSPLERFDVGFPRKGKTIGQGPTELMIRDGRATLFFSTHSKHWANDWRSWLLTSDDSFQMWSQPQEVPGRLKERTFIRNHIITRDGRILLPFQHYIGPESEQQKPPLYRAFTNPRNGVLMSADGGKTWSEHGNIRITPNDRYFGWAENNLVEFSDGRIGMIIRADGLGGVLYYAESKDGGRTWPEFSSITKIPNPGSKATLYSLGGDAVAMLHNPNSKHRSPLALWISFDGMKTWPYQRVLHRESCDGPQGRINYPDGFVSADRQWLHFAFDDNRHRAVHYSAKLPPIK